jgi:hypothetical protein
MANVVNYVTKFEKQLKQKYSAELKSAALSSPEGGQGIRFIDTKTIKIPFVSVGGYKDHSRAGGFNRQAVENDFFTKTLAHDRDVEFFVDVMDVDETNQTLAAANVTNTFLEQQAIPETDSYRFSKLAAEYVSLGGVLDNTQLTQANILSMFDEWMQEMDEAEVPEEGRFAYATPTYFRLLKEAQGVSRSIKADGSDKAIDRRITKLDNVSIVKVPSARMKTAYDFSDGFVPGASAKQINMMLLHPSAIIGADKHAYIHLWAPGTHTQGDGYLYQNRKYGDLFVIDTRVKGIKINAEGADTGSGDSGGGDTGGSAS